MPDKGREPDTVGPVVTMSVDGSPIGVLVDQVERIVLARDLVAVPDSQPEHLGLLFHDNELVPVMTLRPRQARDEEMVAVVHVRGQSVGLSVDDAGRIHSRWEHCRSEPGKRPVDHAVPACALNSTFWLIDTDRLWPRADDTTAARQQ